MTTNLSTDHVGQKSVAKWLRKCVKDLTEGKEKNDDVKECQMACCETDLCNSAFITSGSIAMMTGSIAMMMTAAMFSLVLFLADFSLEIKAI